jgi:predicted acyl esterase
MTAEVDSPDQNAFGALTVAEQDLKVFGRVDEIWRRFCSEGPDSDYWKSARNLSKVGRVTAPVLHQSGWFDGDSLETMRNYLAAAHQSAEFMSFVEFSSVTGVDRQ